MGVIVLPLVSASIPTNRIRSRLLVSTAVPALVASFGAVAHAGGLPTGGIPTAGTTITTPSSTQMQITSTTTRSAISWQDFSIGSGNSVNITQPNANSTQLESVRGTNVSQIFGSLTSNGSIVVANPNGIWFGPNAQVDVAGLAAVAANPSAADVQTFIHGGSLNLSQAGSANAAIINQGTITISNAGLAAFVAPGVRNDGIIQAKLGTVQLSSGTTATLDFYGDGLISIAVSGQTLAQAIDPSTGKPMTAAVGNTGTINADGGTVLLTANTASNIVNDAINVSGVVQARSVSQQNGQIVLDGGSNGNVQVAGSLDASGTGTGQTGGHIEAVGQTVTLAGTAVLDASGDQGGGTVYVGGGPHGQGTIHVATTTTVAKGATIKANAITAGNGGTAAVWSQQHTSFDGIVEAAGGTQGGNGGFVETSGAKLTIGGDATVNTSAMRGQSGLWLLDPNNITIATSGGDITPSTITTALSSGNVEIDTVDDPGASGTAGTIFVNNAVTYGSANSLSLLAQGDIDVNASIQNSSTGAINLVAGWDGATGLSGGGAGVYTGTVSIGTIQSTSTAFGNVITGATGSVIINSAGSSTGIAVGSASGTTTVLGNNITLTAATGNSTNGGFAQIGYALGTGAPLGGSSATGAIVVDAKGNVTLTAGGVNNTTSDNYAQIGHGGPNANPSGQMSGSITVTAGGAVSVIGGQSDSNSGGGSNYAQIGHGGDGDYASHAAQLGTAGDLISVTAAGAVSLQANGAYAQIGDGGSSVVGPTGVTITTDITVQGSSVTVHGGFNNDTYAQIGNGGYNIGGNTGTDAITGNISVTATAGGVSLTGGSLEFGYAQIGHGGAEDFFESNATSITTSGSITVNATGNINLSAAAGFGASYAQIGHGGFWEGLEADSGKSGPLVFANTGAISVNSSGGAVVLTAGTGTGGADYAQIGHGGLASWYQAGWQGPAGSTTTRENSGGITVGAHTSIALSGGSNGGSYAQIGNGGALSLGGASTPAATSAWGDFGDINITAASLSLAGGDSNGDGAMVGGGGLSGTLSATFFFGLSSAAVGDVSSNTLVTLSGSLGASAANNYLGNVTGTANGATGLVSVGASSIVTSAGINLGGNTTFDTSAGNGVQTFGGALNAGSNNITINTGTGNVTLGGVTAGALTLNNTGIATETLDAGTYNIGSSPITWSAANGLTLNGSGGALVFDQSPTFSGAITLASDTLLEAPSASGTITFGSALSYSNSLNLAVLSGGAIDVNAAIQNAGAGNVSLVAGWDGTAPTSASNVANIISGTHYGSSGGNVVIGNGSQTSTVAIGSAGGATTVLGDNVTLQGSGTSDSNIDAAGHDGTGAQIGFNVPAGGTAAATGSITVDALGAVLLQAGSGNGAFAQIGHGGVSAALQNSAFTQSLTGDIVVDAAAVTLASNSIFDAYAQIGHGGFQVAFGDNEIFAGSFSLGGNITVNASGTIALHASTSYVQIGHGGDDAFISAPVPAGFATTGNITVGAASLTITAGSSANNYAQIGHGEDTAANGENYTGGVSGNIDIIVTSTLSTSGQNILIGSRATGTVTTPLFIEARDFGGGFSPSSVEDTAGGPVVVAVTDPTGYTTSGFTASGGNTFALLTKGELSVTGTIGSDGTIDLIGGWNGTSGVPSAGGTFDLSAGTGVLSSTGNYGNGSAGSNGISLGANVSTSGSGGVTLAGPVTLTSTIDLTGATVTVLSALDAATNGGESLTVTGNAAFDGAVGGTHELGTLDVTGGATLAGGSVTTTTVQTYGGAVTLGADTTLTATNGSGASNNTITFDSTVDGAHALTVDSTWPAVFDGAVGGTTPLASLSVPTFVSFGASVGSVKTSGPMSLGVTGNSVTAAGNLTLDSSAGSGAISLGQFGGLGNTLAVSSGSGAVTFDGVMVPKLVVTSTGTETLNSGTYHITSGTNTYENSNGAVTLEGNLVFSSTPFAFGTATLAADTDISTFSGAPNVTFLGTVDATTAGAQGLTISTSSGSGLTATTTFGGVVGGIHALKTLSLTDSAGTTTISGGSITTSSSGGQSFAGAVVLTGATTLDSSAGNGPIAFAGAISGAGDTLTIKSSSGNVTFGGVTVGALSVTSTGSETLNAGTYDIGTGTAAITWGSNSAVTLDGALVFDQPATFDTATLAGNTTVDTSAGNGAVDFTGNIGGAGDTLVITSGSGNVTFNGLTVAALSVTTTGTETVDAGTYAIGNGSTPYTWGTVALDGIYVFGQDTTFGVVTLDANTTISTTGGTNAVTFGSTVDAASSGAESLTVDTSGATTFSGNVGHSAALASLTVTGPATLGGNVTTTGSQTYGGPVTLATNVTLSGSGGVDLVETVDSSGTGVTTDGHGLTVSGNATFGGVVGGNFALGSLLVTGTTALNGGTVDTTGGQTYSGAITLGGNTTLDSAAGNGAIHFGGSVNGASDTLTINTGTGGVIFSGFDFNVAGLSIIGPETLDTGTYTLTGGTLTNSAGIGLEGTLDFAQNMTFASAVTLDANTSIVTTSGSATITFGSTVTGAHALTVNTTGATTFDGNVTTAGGQAYSGPVTLGSNITLTDTSGGTIDFGSTLAGAVSTNVTIVDNTAPVFGGTVSEIIVATLAPDTTSATIGVGDSSLEALIGTVKYDFKSTGGLANLAASGATIDIGTGSDTGTLTLTQLGGSASTTPGYFALMNGGGGAIAISGAYVGNAALTVQSGSGGITLGANVTTAFNQVYSGNVTVGATSVTLSATSSSGLNSHGVDFTGTVDGASVGADALTVDLGNTGINATFDGNVGGNFALASLTANTGTGRAVFNNGISVTTSGSGGQSYSDGATLNGDTIFAAGGSNPIVFGYIVTGAHTLTVTSGATTFSGDVSVGTLNVQAVDIAAGSSNFGTITTTGGQTYSGAISLGTNALLEATGTSATITFDGASAYTSGSSLGVLAIGNIDVNAPIQNSGSGAISLVAGWNGTTQPTSASNVANIISGTNTFGQNSGSVLVGTGTQTGRDAVGSAGGATVVLGDNVILTGGSAGGTDTDAQIGFRGANATGAITVDALGAVELLGGSDTHAYAQIGHGGALVDLTGSATSGTLSGSIDVTAGSVTLAGGTGNVAYAQIGHGGAFGFSGNGTIGTITVSGGITVDATGNIDITGGDTAASNGTSYGQIGHGGFGFAVSTTLSGGDAVSGDIVVSGANIGLAGGAGSGARNYAQIGMRTGDASTISSSNIDVRSTGTLTVSSGTSGGFLIGEAVPTGSTTTGDNVFVEAASVIENGGTANVLGSNSNLALNLGGDTTAGSVAFAITSAGGLTIAGVTYSGSGALAFLTEGPLVVDSGGVANTGAGSIGLVSGWDGSTGVPGTPGASAFNISAVLSGASGTVYGSGGNGITLGGNVTTGLTTGNAIALAGPVTLDANLIVGSAGGTTEFLGTVDSSDIATAGTSDGHGLTVSGNASFGGAVGGTFRLGGLEVLGTTTLPSSVATSGGQDYLGSVTLGAGTVTLSDSGTAGITFGSSVNGSGDALDVTEGTTTFDSAVTVGSLDLQAAAFAAAVTQTISTTAGQTYNGAVTVAGAVHFNDSNLGGSAITFDGTVDGVTTGAGSVFINTSGTATFSAAVGHGNALASLNIDSATIDLSGGSVTTSGSGGQTYQGPVTLGVDTTLVATGTNATVEFNSNNSTVSGNHALTIAAAGGTLFGAAIDVSSLSVTNTTGQITFLAPSVTTSGSAGQFYGGPVVLFSSPTLDAGTGNPVVFQSTIDSNTSGHNGLTITGNATFSGAVGSGTALGSLGVTGTTDLSGGTVVTTGGQTYGGPVVLGGATTLSDSAVDFQSTVNSSDIATAGTTDGNSLTVSGAATFGGTVGGAYALGSLDVTGGTTIDGASVDTTGNQTYGGAVSLDNTGGTTFGASSLLNAGAIDFTSTVDGVSGASLTIAIGANSVTFAGSVGATGPLSAITDKATNTVIGGATMATSGTQQYLSDNTTLTNTSGTTFSVSTSGGYIAFSTLDGATAGTVPLTVSLTGNVVDFTDPVGANAPLESILVTGGETLFDTTTIKTTGIQEYGGAVSVREANVVLTGSTVTFDSTVDSYGGPATFGDGLTVSGNASFGDTVGGTYALGSLDVTGTTAIGTAVIMTTGGQTYGGAVSLGTTSATLTSTNGGAIDLLGAVDGLGPVDLGPSALLISTGGSVSLGGTIGGVQPLASLTVDPGPDDLTISSTAIITTGAQLYEHPVVLAASTTLTGTSVTFDDAVDSSDAATAGVSDGHGLTVSGAATFGGPVGGTYALGSLDVTGSTEFNPGSAALDVVTTGTQEYDGGISVDSGSGSVVLEVTSATGTITLGGDSSYDSSADLSLLSEGGIAFDHSLRNFGSGAINVVAGWDGSTGLSSGAFSFGTLSSAISSGSYTQGAGDVSIGDGTQTSGIDVGSRDGDTNVAADNVTLKGSTGTADGYAQLGYNADRGAFSASGNITVLASGAVELLGGANQAYAQIGHGGYLAGEFSCGGGFTIASNIDVLALSVTLAGGTGSDAYAQIGHGGDQAFAGNTALSSLTLSGTIGVTATGGDVSLSGGTGGDAYAQIGHGGDQALVNASANGVTLGGSIDVSAGGNIVVAGGTSTTTSDNYAQIGHGGLEFAANTGPNDTSLGDLSVTGDITVTSTGTSGTISLGGGSDQSDYVQIGHGGLAFAENQTHSNNETLTSATLSGDITVGAAGNISLTGGSGGGSADAFDAYAQIGHGGDAALSDIGTALTITGATQIGGTISVVSSSGSVSLGGNDDYAYAQIGHGGLTFGTFGTFADVSVTGDITVDGATGVNVTGGAGSTFGGPTNYTNTGAYAQIGNGGEAILSGATAGAVTLGGAITVDGGSGGVDLTGGSASGNLSNSVSFGDSYAQIGLGGDSAFIGANFGSLTVGGATSTIGVSTSGAVALNGGSGGGDYAQVGDGGFQFASNATVGTTAGTVFTSGGVTLSGDITVGAASVTLAGDPPSGGAFAYAQIGHGGGAALYNATAGDVTVGGDVSVTASAGDISLTAGTGDAAYAQIGHGGAYFGSAENVIVGSTTLLTGTGATFGNMTLDGNIDVEAVHSGGTSGGVFLTGDIGGAYAQIGDGGQNAFSGISCGCSGGPVTLASLTVGGAGETITVTGDDGIGLSSISGGYAQIGDGGLDFADGAQISGAATITGDIGVDAVGGRVTLTGDAGSGGYAQIGHGGADAFRDATAGSLGVSGGITVTAHDDVGVSGGSHFGAYAQIGHGGADFAEGAQISGATTVGGDISVDAVSGGVSVGGGFGAYAQIGHGGLDAFEFAELGSLTIGGTSADITVTADDAVSLAGGSGENAYAQIGHGGKGFASDATVGTTTGTVFTSGGVTLSGDITVGAESVTLGGGSGHFAYAQIGHGGGTALYNATAGDVWIGGDVSVTASDGDISLTAGSGEATYAQIGHGGAYFGSAENVVVNPTTTLLTGTGATFGSVTLDGNVTVEATNSGGTSGGVFLTGGSDPDAYAQIGHGGSYVFAGAASCGCGGGPITLASLTVGGAGEAITVASDQDINLTGGSSDGAYVQIGHGGYAFASEATVGTTTTAGFTGGAITVSGDIAVTTGNSYSFSAVGSLSHGGTGAYVQVGHGGYAFAVGSNFGSAAIGGNVDVSVPNGYAFIVSGENTYAYAQIGHGGADAFAFTGTTVSPTYGGIVSVNAGELGVGSFSPVAYGVIGSGDPVPTTIFGGNGVLSGTVDVTTLGDQRYFVEFTDVILAGGTYSTSNGTISFSDGFLGGIAPVVLSGSITIENSTTVWGLVEGGPGVTAPNMTFNLSGQDTTFTDNAGSATQPIGTLSVSGGGNFTIVTPAVVTVDTFVDHNMSGIVDFGHTLSVLGTAFIGDPFIGDLVCASGGTSCIVGIDGFSLALNFDFQDQTLHLFDIQYALSNPGFNFLPNNVIVTQAGCTAEEKQANGGSCPAGGGDATGFGNAFLGGSKP